MCFFFPLIPCGHLFYLGVVMGLSLIIVFLWVAVGVDAMGDRDLDRLLSLGVATTRGCQAARQMCASGGGAQSLEGV
jgi:hypothetical protein